MDLSLYPFRLSFILFHCSSGADPVLNPFPGSDECIMISQSCGSADEFHKHAWNVCYKPRIGSYWLKFHLYYKSALSKLIEFVVV